jgi:hypothetical protein
MKRLFLCAFCVLFFTFQSESQSVLTADGLAAFVAPVSGGGGGGGDDLTGISLRYIADNVTGSDGDPVSSWPDTGGNSKNATQPTSANQPVIKVGVVNGHRAVLFDGSNDVVTNANTSPTLIGSAQATAIFVVIKQTGSQANNSTIGFENTDFVRVYATFGDTLYFDWANASGGRINGGQPVGWDDAWHVLEVHRNGANQSVLVDGVSVVTSAASTGSLGQSGTGTFYIGNTGAAIPFKGQIAEVRVYNQDKGSTSSTTIRAALKTTYGTP